MVDLLHYLGIRTRRVQLGLCPMICSSTTSHPIPILPAYGPPRLPLLYSTPGPSSAVTYTAERYSYGRVGQKERQVRCPPTLREMCPLDQGGLHAYNYCCQLARPPTHSHTSTGPGICLSAHLPTRGFMPPFSACLPGATISKNPALPAPATSHQASEQARSKEPGQG